MTLGALVNFILDLRAEVIFRSALFLRGKDALVEELGVLLTSVECVVANELIVSASLRATVSSGLTILAMLLLVVVMLMVVEMRCMLLSHICSHIGSIVVHSLEFIVFIHGIIVVLVLVVADGVPLFKLIHLILPGPLLIVVSASSIQVI